MLVALVSQAGAFAPTRSLHTYQGISSSVSSYRSIHTFPASSSKIRDGQVSMVFNSGRHKDRKLKLESTSLQSTAVLDDIPKSVSKNPFTRWVQSVAWPSKKELKKLLPLGTMLFFILFNYTILRDTKVHLIWFLAIAKRRTYVILSFTHLILAL